MAALFRRTKRMENAENPANASRERRLLHIEVIEARGILGMIKSRTGDVSDPYATINLVDLADREIKSESFKTNSKSATVTPVWQEVFAFGKNYNLDIEDDQLPSVSVQIFHRSTFSVSETPLGIVRIFLDGKQYTRTQRVLSIAKTNTQLAPIV